MKKAGQIVLFPSQPRIQGTLAGVLSLVARIHNRNIVHDSKERQKL
jgi:hypothetical protein